MKPLMVATMVLDGAFLVYVASYMARGGFITGLDGLVSVAALLCVIGAAMVLVGLVRGQRFTGLAVAVSVIGLGVPLLILGLVVVFGAPMVFV